MELVQTMATAERGRETWGRLAHAFAHELRGPLNALGLYVELLSMQREPASGEALSTRAREQVQRMDQLLGDLLLLWAPGAEGPTDLSAIVSVAVRLAARDGRHRADRFTVDVERGLRAALGQAAVVDVVVGMVTAVAAGGGPVRVRLARDGRAVRLEVSGEGVAWGQPPAWAATAAGEVVLEALDGGLAATFAEP